MQAETTTNLRPPADLPVVKIDHVLKFADDGRPEQAVFSPDGKTLYVGVSYRPLDLAWMVRSAVPYIQGGLFLLPLLLTVLWVVRIKSRKRQPGEQYCARCNYHLAGIAADRCPECGRSLAARGTRVGGRTWRRWVGPVAILLIGVGSIVLSRRLDQYRSPVSIAAPNGWAEFARRHNWLTLFAHRTFAATVYQIDVASGQVTRRFAVESISFDGPILLTPDAGRLLFCGRNLFSLDLRNGRVRTLGPSGAPDMGYPGQGLCGVSSDGKVAYVMWGDGESNWNSGLELLRCRLDASEPETILSWDRERFRSLSRTSQWTPSAFLIPGDTEKFLIVPRTLTKGPDVRELVPGGIYDVKSGTLSGPWDHEHLITPMFSADGTRAVFQGPFSAGDAPFPPRTEPHWRVFTTFSALDQRGRIFAFDEDQKSAAVFRDLVDESWIARLKYPPEFRADGLFIDPNGTQLAITEGPRFRPGRLLIATIPAGPPAAAPATPLSPSPSPSPSQSPSPSPSPAPLQAH